MITEKKVRESTIDFGFNKEIYEAAWEHLTYYTALKQTPRKEDPFKIYDYLRRDLKENFQPIHIQRA